jgi:thioredoxin
MANKKLLIIGGCATLLLVVALFVGAVAGIGFYTIAHSEAAQTAKDFLRRNEKLKADVGEVQDFGWLVSGQIGVHNTDGQAALGLKVIGARRTADATVRLAYRGGQPWRVVGASYEDAGGRAVSLFDPYADAAPTAEQGGDAGGPGAGFDEQSFKTTVLEAEGPVLVFVGSPSSLDSRAVEQTLEQLDSRYTNNVTLISYTIDEQPGVLARLRVTTVPTLVLYVQGAERERLSGLVTREEIAGLLDKYPVAR